MSHNGRHRRIGAVTVAAFVAVTALSAAIGVPAHGGSPSARYIVVLANDSDAAAVAREHQKTYGAKVDFVYEHALKGYAAAVDPALVSAIEGDARVLFVNVDDRSAQIPPVPRPPRAAPGVPQPAQAISNGVARVDGDLSSTASGDGKGAVSVNVAVLDSGIDWKHPDLRVAGGVNCQPGERRTDFFDRDGHGTMVAGFIGALDNDIGRVGIAPGANLYGVRIFDPDGWGSDAMVLCGIDWVTSTRLDANPRNDVAVANYSAADETWRGEDDNCGLTNHDAQHYAFCGSTAAGVTWVVAAGNEAADITDLRASTYSEVLTVTAMADRDGQPGGQLPPPWGCDPSETSGDDAAADFSNFATDPSDFAHIVAAPGVCISSTFPENRYAVWSGTSFATPIVTGTVALCIASGPCAGLTPGQIIEKIIGDAAAYNTAHPGYGFVGDPLRPVEGKYYGYLVRAGLY